MESSTFDRLSRLVAGASSRRALTGAFLGALAGLIGVGTAESALCPKGKKPCRKQCIPRRHCCTTANCRPGATGRVCQAGTCRCPPARPKKCNGRCIPRARCCGAECNPPPPPDACAGVTCGAVLHGDSVCQDGHCVISSCDPGYANCDGNPATGCETNINIDPEHCGACAAQCTTEAVETCDKSGVCAAGTCQRYGTETVCRAASCAGLILTKAVRCDGSGNCPAGEQQNCDDGNQCTNDRCEAATQTCEHTNVVDGQVCTGGVCDDGVCRCSQAGGVCQVGRDEQCCDWWTGDGLCPNRPDPRCCRMAGRACQVGSQCCFDECIGADIGSGTLGVCA